MSADKVNEAWEELCEAIDHVSRANWPGRDIEARRMAHEAFQKALAAVREDEKARCIAAVKALPGRVIPTHAGLFEVTEAIRNA